MNNYMEWDFVQTLGEGAYGEVKLAVSTKTSEQVAVKIIDTLKDESVTVNVRKECVILNTIQKRPHPHIIKFLAYKKNGPIHYIFLEFASGGELFDRIIPDEGMDKFLAQRYFRQLCQGVEHLHHLGVTHRDLKPENLLLNGDDNLLITDFGLSTVFKYQGKMRKLDRKCGTPPYAAPEVLVGTGYYAEPADIWSCGIVLVAMLAGELPWDEPLDKFKEFYAWKNSKILYTPWTKLSESDVTFLKGILNVSPKERLTFQQIYNESWYIEDVPLPICERPNKYLKRSNSTDVINSGHLNAFSQPDIMSRQSGIENCSLNTTREIFNSISFSQPLHQEYLMLSQLDLTQGASQATQSILQRLVRRLTRFLVKLTFDDCNHKIMEYLKENKLRYKHLKPSWYTINFNDKRGSMLTFKIQLLEMVRGNILVDFRLSKGDGLEFKRQFQQIRRLFDSDIVRNMP